MTSRNRFNKFFRAVRLNTNCFGGLKMSFILDLTDQELKLAQSLVSRFDADPLVLRRLERELWGAK